MIGVCNEKCVVFVCNKKRRWWRWCVCNKREGCGVCFTKREVAVCVTNKKVVVACVTKMGGCATKKGGVVCVYKTKKDECNKMGGRSVTKKVRGGVTKGGGGCDKKGRGCNNRGGMHKKEEEGVTKRRRRVKQQG